MNEVLLNGNRSLYFAGRFTKRVDARARIEVRICAPVGFPIHARRKARGCASGGPLARKQEHWKRLHELGRKRERPCGSSASDGALPECAGLHSHAEFGHGNLRKIDAAWPGPFKRKLF